MNRLKLVRKIMPEYKWVELDRGVIGYKRPSKNVGGWNVHTYWSPLEVAEHRLALVEYIANNANPMQWYTARTYIKDKNISALEKLAQELSDEVEDD
jgi:hypothetical protein